MARRYREAMKSVAEVTRPWCAHPWLGFGGNVTASAACFSAAGAGVWLPLSQAAAAVFAGCAILFPIVGVFRPCTRVAITDSGITRRGPVLRRSLAFAEAISAEIILDDANHRMLVLRPRRGSGLTLDARFLDPDSDGIAALVSERLRAHGVALKISG